MRMILICVYVLARFLHVLHCVIKAIHRFTVLSIRISPYVFFWPMVYNIHVDRNKENGMNRDMKLALVSSGLLVAFTVVLMVDVLMGRATVTAFNALSFTVACLVLGYANRLHYISATATAFNGVCWFIMLIKVI